MSVFAFLSRHFRGSEETENPCFLVGFPCVFLKRQRKEDYGRFTQKYRVLALLVGPKPLFSNHGSPLAVWIPPLLLPLPALYPCDRPDQVQKPRALDLENSRVGPGQSAGKQPKNSYKNTRRTQKQLFVGCLAARPAAFPALDPLPTRHLFRLFFGCFQGPAFGASVVGRADLNCIPLGSLPTLYLRLRQLHA